MVFNLVIEVTVQRVVDVTASPKVYRCQNLTKVELSRVRTTPVTETIHVITGMVGHDGYEAMDVR